MKKILIIGIVCLPFLLVGCANIVSKNTDNNLSDDNIVINPTIISKFLPIVYDKVKFDVSIPMVKKKYDDIVQSGVLCNENIEGGIGGGIYFNECYNVTGYQGEYIIPEWNITFWESEGQYYKEVTANADIFTHPRQTAYYITGNTVLGYLLSGDGVGREYKSYTFDTEILEKIQYYRLGKNDTIESILKKYNLTTIYNDLPDIIQDQQNLEVYKKANKLFVFDRAYRYYYIYTLPPEGGPILSMFAKIWFFKS